MRLEFRLQAACLPETLQPRERGTPNRSGRGKQAKARDLLRKAETGKAPKRYRSTWL